LIRATGSAADGERAITGWICRLDLPAGFAGWICRLDVADRQLDGGDRQLDGGDHVPAADRTPALAPGQFTDATVPPFTVRRFGRDRNPYRRHRVGLW